MKSVGRTGPAKTVCLGVILLASVTAAAVLSSNFSRHVLGHCDTRCPVSNHKPVFSAVGSHDPCTVRFMLAIGDCPV